MRSPAFSLRVSAAAGSRSAGTRRVILNEAPRRYRQTRALTEGDAHHLLVHGRLEEGVGALCFGDRFRHRAARGQFVAPTTGQALRWNARAVLALRVSDRVGCVVFELPRAVKTARPQLQNQ